LSELFGEKTIGIDKFFRTISLHETAKKAVENLSEEEREILQAYSDGVNDFISNVGLFKADSSANLLPPEFYLFSLRKIEPWTPVDSICLLKLLNFHLSWNWS
jgi:penicillin amidase